MPEEYIRSPGTGDRGGYEMPDMGSERETSPLKEKQILLTTGPFFLTLKSLLAEKKGDGDFFFSSFCML